MRSEIGSEFWDIPVADKDNAVFPIGTNWFISGRHALQAIIDENSFTSVSLPFWCCESIIKPFVDKGIKINFYSDKDIISNIDTDAVVIVDYFGYTNRYSIKDTDSVLIRDTTHSIFSMEERFSDYCFGSLRKWAGFWTGGYAWGFKNEIQYKKGNNEFIELRRRAMEEKHLYMDGKISNKEYLKTFERAEKLLENAHILEAANRDVEIVKKLDVDFIKHTRRKNANILLKAFKKNAIFTELQDEDCPLFVPIRVKMRDKLRNYLIENNIYCPVHWPISKYHKLNSGMELLYEEELSLVCDQRYDEADMYRIIDTIQSFYSKNEMM